MPMPKLNWLLMFKCGVAVIALAVLAGVAGSGLAPGVPLPTVLLYSAVGALAGLAVLVALAALSVSWARFSIRNGGTDPQWLWFAAEPPGMASVREELAARPSSISTEPPSRKAH